MNENNTVANNPFASLMKSRFHDIIYNKKLKLCYANHRCFIQNNVSIKLLNYKYYTKTFPFNLSPRVLLFSIIIFLLVTLRFIFSFILCIKTNCKFHVNKPNGHDQKPILNKNGKKIKINLYLKKCPSGFLNVQYERENKSATQCRLVYKFQFIVLRI